MTITTIQPISSHHASIVQVVEQTHFDSEEIADNQNPDDLFDSETIPENQNADELFDSEAVPDSQNADGLFDTEAVPNSQNANDLFESESTADNQNGDKQSISCKPFREFAIEQMNDTFKYFEEYERLRFA